jgi:hypothetical protein
VLAILRDFLDEHLLRTGRTSDDRIFGRSVRQVFYASTVDGRAKRAWMARNAAGRKAAEGPAERPPRGPAERPRC